MLFYYLASVFKSIAPRVDDYTTDKLNYFITTSLLSVFACLVSAKQYVGRPIECWVPATFTIPMEQYAESFCWAESTYWVAMDDGVPRDIFARKEKQLNYYQWVPFVMATQALLFFLPSLIWRGALHHFCGFNVQQLVVASRQSNLIDPEGIQKVIKHLAHQMQSEMYVVKSDGSGKKYGGCSCLRCHKLNVCGCCLSLSYIFVKWLYLVNSVGQFLALNEFLGTSNLLYGIQVFIDLCNGREWEKTGTFPRVTLCDFEIRVLANVHRHTVQCVLMINMFNEKLFLFLWFWLLLLSLVTFVSLMYWPTILFMPGSTAAYVGRMLADTLPSGQNRSNYKCSVAMNRFVTRHLTVDHVFLLRLIAAHGGEALASELVERLWKEFDRSYQQNTVSWNPTLVTENG